MLQTITSSTLMPRVIISSAASGHHVQRLPLPARAAPSFCRRYSSLCATSISLALRACVQDLWFGLQDTGYSKLCTRGDREATKRNLHGAQGLTFSRAASSASLLRLPPSRLASAERRSSCALSSLVRISTVSFTWCWI